MLEAIKRIFDGDKCDLTERKIGEINQKDFYKKKKTKTAS